MTASSPSAAVALPVGTRPLHAGDEPAIRAAARESYLRGELEGVSRHLLDEFLAHLFADPRLVAVAEEDGRAVGWVAPLQDELSVDRSYRRRGHGRRLVEAGRVLAGEVGLPALRLWVPKRPEARAFAAACGLRERSSIWQLAREVGPPPDPPAFPADVVTRPIRPGADEPAFVALVNEIFVDHTWPLVLDEAAIRKANRAPGFDPSTVLLVARADDPERLIGFCRVARYEDDDGAMVGEVKLLGVRPEARGRGLGLQLTRWGVDDLRRRGVDRFHIVVEARNTGAFAMYEREGFLPRIEWPHWTAPLPG